MSSNPRIPSPAIDDRAHRKPTRRTMLNALAVLPVASGALIGAAAGAGETSPATPGPSLAELHRQWAPLHAEVSRLDLALSDVEEEAGHDFIRRKGRFGTIDLRSDAEIDNVIAQEVHALRHRREELEELRASRKRIPEHETLWPNSDADIDRWIADETRPERRQELEAERRALKARLGERRAENEAAYERLGGPRMEAERDQAARALEAVLVESRAAPIRNIADIAALLDVAMGEGEIDATMASEPDDSPLTRQLLRALVRQVPGFEFASLRVDLVPERYDRLFADAT